MESEVNWRIYYDDGLPSCNTDRKFGVIVIVQKNETVGREIVSGFDWYYFKKYKWYGSDLLGLIDQVIHFTAEIETVLQGRMIAHADYQRVLSRALNDPDFPKKTGWKPTERQ